MASNQPHTKRDQGGQDGKTPPTAKGNGKAAPKEKTPPPKPKGPERR